MKWLVLLQGIHRDHWNQQKTNVDGQKRNKTSHAEGWERIAFEFVSKKWKITNRSLIFPDHHITAAVSEAVYIRSNILSRATCDFQE